MADPGLILCGLDEPLEVSGPDCPRADLHEPQPQGYAAWHDWAGRQGRAGRTQHRCPGCGLYQVWTPALPKAAADA